MEEVCKPFNKGGNCVRVAVDGASVLDCLTGADVDL
jgi:hypothetical protein